MLTFFGISISRIVSSFECVGDTATTGETPLHYAAVCQRQKDTVQSLLKGSEIRGPELFEFVYQQMAGNENDVDILQLLVQHDSTIHPLFEFKYWERQMVSLGACLFSVSLLSDH
mmetsp:Transcript_614/g.1134  ORF Transcript_614/g.1134 Transcript_614/m.1134 type:complete len:115 (+) Transcript_614:311-655(+)